MRKKIWAVAVVIGMVFTPLIAVADFSVGNLAVVNNPSAMSAGIDSVVEFNPAGNNIKTLVPTSRNVTGMSRVVFDPHSGHLFYSVSHWPNRIFEIREIDFSGNRVATHAHPDFGSGNISMAFDKTGDLYIANDGYIYVKRAGQPDILQLFTLPYTGIGDLVLDSMGNLYLSDPFISDGVYKIFPDGSVTVFADPSDGLDSPYGLAVDKDDNLYIANYVYSGTSIVKVTQSGDSTVFATENVRQGIIDMTFDSDDNLYVANREYDTIYAYDKSGNSRLFANGADGLFVPSSLAFITAQSSCEPDADRDGDVDGLDLVQFSILLDLECLVPFAQVFGAK